MPLARIGWGKSDPIRSMYAKQAARGEEAVRARSAQEALRQLGRRRDVERQMEDLTRQMEAAYRQTRAANERRYQEVRQILGQQQQDVSSAFEAAQAEKTGMYDEKILPYLRQRYDTAMGYLQGFGTQQRQDIERSYEQQAARAKQDLVTSGLSGSTVAPSIRAGYERRKQEDLNRFRDYIAQLNLGTHLGASADVAKAMQQRAHAVPTAQDILGLQAPTTNLAGFMERRQDVGPTLQDIAAITSMASGYY